MKFKSELTEQASYNIPSGAIVQAAYLGEFRFRGVVMESRCKLNGKKQYVIKLLQDLKLPFKNTGYKIGHNLAVDNDCVICYDVNFKY